MIAFAADASASPSSAQGSQRPVPIPVPADTEILGDEIARLAAHIHAATYHLLVLIRAFDEREGWGGGFKSCAHWLSWRTGISPGPAREKVRVARSLAALPLLSEAMARGELSYSKVRALTRIATPDNEEELLRIARQGTAAHLEKVVRFWRLADRLEDSDAEAVRHEQRFLKVHPDDDGSWVIQGRLDPEVGALLQKALDWAAGALYRESETGGSLDACPTAEQRRSDAIGLLAERAIAGRKGAPGGRSDRYQVVVEMQARGVSAETSNGIAASGEPSGPDEAAGDGGAESGPRDSTGNSGNRPQGGRMRRDQTAGVTAPSVPRFPSETTRRLACDASVVAVLSDFEGRVLDVGRKRRTVPPALRRALERRDGGCRFPGCGCKYTDAHHVTHWADGGETRLENLVLLCRRHHRAVHEDQVRVEICSDGIEVSFRRPDGRSIPVVPEPPALPVDPVSSVMEAHQARGIDPGPWTPTPGWFGEAMNYGMAIETLRNLPKGDIA